MTEQNINKVQEALTIVAQVCEVHVATASDHRVIANSLKTITDTIASLIRENTELKTKKVEVEDKNSEKVECGAV